MNPKDKAEQLVQRFIDKAYSENSEGLYTPIAKQCAIIMCDEIIRETKLHDKTIYQHCRTGYWFEVKTEIEKL